MTTLPGRSFRREQGRGKRRCTLPRAMLAGTTDEPNRPYEGNNHAAATARAYIVTDDQILGGEPIIRGTRTPVRAIVELWRLGVAPEEVPRRLPHLTLAQVFDALSYYSDHQEEINGHIERNRIPDELLDPLVRDA